MGQHIEKALEWAALVIIASMAGWLMGMAPANAAPPSARAASPMQQPHQAPAASLDLRAPVLEAEQQRSNLFPSLTHRDTTGVSDLTTFN